MTIDQALVIVALRHYLGIGYAEIARATWYAFCVPGRWAPPMIPDWEAEGQRLVLGAEGVLGYPPGTLQPGGGPLPAGGALPL